MPTQADQLTEGYRQQQQTLGAATAAAMLLAWRTYSWTGPDTSDDAKVRSWITLAIRLVLGQRARSTVLAQTYLRGLTRLELGEGADVFTPTPLELDPQAIAESMYVTGIRPLERAYREIEARRAPGQPDGSSPLIVPVADLERFAAASAAAAQRHTLDGGRTAIDDAIRSDPRVIGYQRVGTSTPCFWCAMLNSRGPVYSEQSFSSSDPRFSGPGDAKCHDGCSCSLRPLYRRADLTGTAQPALEARWLDATAGTSGKAAIKRWRQVYEGRATE